MANIYEMTDTWNDGAVAFTAIGMDVTDTASDAASLRMDLQVGGASKFSVGKGAGAYFSPNLFEQRNSTNAQTFNIYNTYTDASNYERGFMKWLSNSLEIGTEKGGTGSTRNIFVRVGGTRSAIFSNTYVQFDVDLYPTQNIIMAAKYTEMSEMTAPAAPATNKVRIYAEDDGAGKTRLMALFPTGAAQQIAIEP